MKRTKEERDGKVIKGFGEKCEAAVRSPFSCVSSAAVSERREKMRGEGANGDEVLLLGVFFYLVLTGEKRNEGMEMRVIAEGSRAAAAVGVAGGSRGRVVRQGGLLGSLPVLESPGRACRACWACWACCIGHKHRDCSPWASGSTCMDSTKESMSNYSFNLLQVISSHNIYPSGSNTETHVFRTTQGVV